MDFTHLHVHTQYSILDGASKIPDLITRTKDLGMSSVAITDHGNMYGVKLFHKTALKAGIKPILGCEAYVAERTRFDKDSKTDRSGSHLVLLAKNRKGYENLAKLVSFSFIEGFYYKPRVDKELLEKYNEGIIACSACLAGSIPQAFLKNKPEKALEELDWYRNTFGDDFYLEIMRHETNKPGANKTVFEDQQIAYSKVIELAKEQNVKLIATNDVHFINEKDAEAHDRLICLTTNADINDPNRLRYTKQEYLKSPEEMAKIFKDVPEAISNTQEIADKVEEYKLDSDPIMPLFPIPEKHGTEETFKEKYTEEDFIKIYGEKSYKRLGGYDKILRNQLESEYLKFLVYEGAKNNYPEITDDIKERIDFELETIKTMGFPSYFLIVWDFLKAARDMGVRVGPGRGSAAGSVVAYCLKITDIDPLKYNLLFERFLNPDRISMPDIDIDFDDEGRERVLKWVVNKYGAKRVANIVTFGTMAAKSSIRDIARVQQLPLDEANRLAKLVPEKPGTNLQKAFAEVPELKKEKTDGTTEVRSVLQYAETLEGSVRQTGVHACGIIIGRDDLFNYIPVATSKDSDLYVTQYDGKHVEDVGLLKMDFLGLKTLSIINTALENVKTSKGIDIDIDNIPLDDPKTYELYSHGETSGLFQFESPGMKKYLKELKPTKFEDLIAMNALYRPGPLEYIPDFINRKHGKAQIKYDFPIMKEILEETYGITVYQEQVMLLSRTMAGFTRGQADSLRKAMGKKIQAMMDELKPKFIEGCFNKHGYEEKDVLKVWNDWEAFAKYAFNKSHATCYSYVSYQTGYLKAHYPAEYMAAVLSHNLNDIKKITFFMDECRRMGVKVLSPDVNESNSNFTVTAENNVRFGLAAIKGVGESAVKNIIEERNANGTYKDIYDFVERVNLQTVNKKCMESLVYAGAFDNFEYDRKDYFALDEKESVFIEILSKYGSRMKEEKNNMQQSLFGGVAGETDITKPTPASTPDWSDIYRANKEKDSIGIYLSSHPLNKYKVELNYLNNTNLTDLEDLTKLMGREITLVGIITEFSEATTKKGNPFGRFTLEDYSGSHEFVLFSSSYIEFKNYLKKDYAVFLKGEIKEKPYRDNEIEYKIKSINMLAQVKEELIKSVTININLNTLTEKIINEIYSNIEQNQGSLSVNFNIYDAEEKLKIKMFSRNLRVKLSDEFIDYLENNNNIEGFKIK